MNPASVCLCRIGRLVPGCPRHAPITAATAESVHEMLIRILENQEKEMAAIDNLLAADAALKAEITQVITDWQAALASAGSDDAQVQQVTADMQGFVSQLQAADPEAASGSGTSAPASPAPAGDTSGTGQTA